ncbi:hypothetical protein Emag_006151 [Eimeria magna]
MASSSSRSFAAAAPISGETLAIRRLLKGLTGEREGRARLGDNFLREAAGGGAAAAGSRKIHTKTSSTAVCVSRCTDCNRRLRGPLCAFPFPPQLAGQSHAAAGATLRAASRREAGSSQDCGPSRKQQDTAAASGVACPSAGLISEPLPSRVAAAPTGAASESSTCLCLYSTWLSGQAAAAAGSAGEPPEPGLALRHAWLAASAARLRPASRPHLPFGRPPHRKKSGRTPSPRVTARLVDRVWCTYSGVFFSLRRRARAKSRVLFERNDCLFYGSQGPPSKCASLVAAAFCLLFIMTSRVSCRSAPSEQSERLGSSDPDPAPRRLSLPIPKRRSPSSRASAVLSPLGIAAGVYAHKQQQHQQNALLGGQQARKYFCVASPAHSSDASTVDDCEEAPLLQCQPCAGSSCCSLPDITSLYSLQRLIGTGSQSFVYECRWVGDNATTAAAAASAASPPAAATAAAAAAARGVPLCIKHIVGECSQEALEAACRLKHPNVAEHLATHKDWRGLWVVMEFVKGPDLAAYLQRWGPLSERATKAVFRQLVSALEYIHARSLVHQDIKLENLVVRAPVIPDASADNKPTDTQQQQEQQQDQQHDAADIQVVLVDFGSAEVGASHQRVLSPRPEASPAGTAMYMAPEAFLESPADSKSDIWSAGIVLCLLLAGRSPFEGRSIMCTLAEPPSPVLSAEAPIPRIIIPKPSSPVNSPSPNRLPLNAKWTPQHTSTHQQKQQRQEQQQQQQQEQQEQQQQQQKQQQRDASSVDPPPKGAPKGVAVRRPSSGGGPRDAAAAAAVEAPKVGRTAGAAAAAAADGPGAVRDRLIAALQQPEWQAVPAAAKELVSAMLNVDAASRPSAAAILRNSWLQSPD